MQNRDFPVSYKSLFRLTLWYFVLCKNRQVTPSLRLSEHLLAALGLIVMHYIYMATSLPSLMCMHVYKRGVA